VVWLKVAVPLPQKLKTDAMRNTDYNTSALGSLLSSDASFQALRDLIDDLGLEVENVMAL
jgi:hypothetical protein